MNNPVLGLDIGGANVKYILLNPDEKKVVDMGCIPLWTKKIDILKKTSGVVKYIVEKTNPESIALVTSFEITDKRPVYTLEAFYENILNEFTIPCYTVTEDHAIVEIVTAKERVSDFIGSAVHGASYIGTHIIDDGVMMLMNSASTIILPISRGRYTPISNDKFCTGEARWIGALYTPVEKIVHDGIVNGHTTKLAPYGAHTIDIFNILNIPQLKQILTLYGIDRKFYPQEDSCWKILHSLACFHDEINIRSINQIKIFSLYVYNTILNIVRDMFFQVSSALHVDPEEIPIIVCGIGKDIILKKALQEYNIRDLERQVPFPLWSFPEALGSALAYIEKKRNIHLDLTEVAV